MQRFPDYWELISPSNSAASAGNAFATLRPEKTTQLDMGAQWKGADWQLWTSAYVGVVRDYILFDYTGMKSAVRNIDARTKASRAERWKFFPFFMATCARVIWMK